MKKSKINPEEVLKDSNKLMKIIDNLSNIDLNNLGDLENELTLLEKEISKKYKPHLEKDEEDLDTEE